MDPEKNGTGADASGATGTQAGASGQQKPDGDAGAGQGQKGGEPFLNKNEFVEYAKRVQKLEDRNKALETELAKLSGKPADAAAGEKRAAGDQGKEKAADGEAMVEVKKLRQELALEKIANEYKLTSEQKQRLERFHKVEQPSDISTWAKGLATEFGWKAGGSESSKKVASDTGAAGGSSDTTHPDDIAQFDPATWKSLSREERRKRFEAQKQASGYSGSTWRKPLPDTKK